MNQIVQSLASSQARLPRADRLRLNQQILSLITDTITTHEVNQQLQSENTMSNIRSLFNGIITYYTEMASYGYTHAPNFLARMGAIVAGSAIIGSTIFAPSPVTQSPGNLLILLSRYISSATTTATGLYFLQSGGLPVQEMLEGVGGHTINCLRTGCNIIATEMNSIWENSINSLQTFVTDDNEYLFEWNSDTQSIISRRMSGSSISTTSSADSARTAIEGILNVSQENVLNLIGNNVPGEINVEGVNVDSQLTSSEFGDIDGGKKRKSRRNGKSKRTKKSKKSIKSKTMKRKGKSIKRKQMRSKTLKKT
jgi:hypothetical protein